MKITYTGAQQKLTENQQKKLDAKLAKLARHLDRRQQREAHVVVTSERHLFHAEITVQLFDRALVGIALDPDLLSALTGAVDKLEKQVLKLRGKVRDTKRGPKEEWQPEAASEAEEAAEAEPAEDGAAGRVFRVGPHKGRKPMTLDEAVLEMEEDRDYLVYRDAVTDRLAVLVRRRDGNFDLIEA